MRPPACGTDTPSRRLTARELNRATLARQMLLGREPVPVPDAVRRVVALQGQLAASPYVALWNRVTALDPAEVDAAFDDGSLVKATLMRITLHVVHGADHRAMHTAMQPTLRASRLGDRRFTSVGVPAAELDALVPELLELAGSPRTTADLETWLGSRLGVPGAGLWWALRSFAPLIHAPTGGPWSYGARPAYVAPRTPSAGEHARTPDDALVGLVVRYLEGFGPASVADIAQFALVQRSRVRAALAAAADGARGAARPVQRLEGPDGAELWDVVGGVVPDGDTPAPPRLMAMWDSVLLSYADRSRMLPPQYRRVVIRSNGDVLPTLLVDGQVAGVWRALEGGIEATAFHPVADDVWQGLDEEARALRRFLADREPTVYRRYHRWWSQLPPGEVRLLGGD